jgi:rubrerythrin
VIKIEKKFFRCNVCNDIHHGVLGPEICPTCKAENAYVEVSKEEAKKITDL